MLAALRAFFCGKPQTPVEQIPSAPNLVSWHRLGPGDYVLMFSNGKSYRGWSHWWRDTETAESMWSRTELSKELTRLFTLIEWGRLADKKIEPVDKA